MKITVSNKILIENPNKNIYEWCYGNLILQNPEYHKKKRMGLWTGNTPQTLQLYEKDGDNLLLPFGCLKSVWKLCNDDDRKCFESQIGDLRHISYDSNIDTYNYQESAVQEGLRAKNGIIVMPCGSGKTQTALEIIARIGGKALWLTHTQDLLNQSMNRAKSVYNLPKESYGTITGGKVNIGSAITFATVQTMSKIDLRQYKDCWDVVIVDECHKAVGSPTKVMQFYVVLSNLCCRYKYGLTATPKRSDGLEQSMFALLGDIIYEVQKEDVADTTCPVNVEFFETGYSPNLDVALSGDGTINYASLVQDMISNEDRLDFVKTICENCANNGPTLVLANRVEYLRRLSDDISGSICLSTLGNTNYAKAVRKESLRKLNDGEIRVIFATYQLAKEGLDVPNLRYLVLATPEKDETTVTQATGRVGRKSDGKTHGTVIDLIDDFGMFRGWSKRRNRYYKKLGYKLLLT